MCAPEGQVPTFTLRPEYNLSAGVFLQSSADDVVASLTYTSDLLVIPPGATGFISNAFGGFTTTVVLQSLGDGCTPEYQTAYVTVDSQLRLGGQEVYSLDITHLVEVQVLDPLVLEVVGDCRIRGVAPGVAHVAVFSPTGQLGRRSVSVSNNLVGILGLVVTPVSAVQLSIQAGNEQLVNTMVSNIETLSSPTFFSVAVKYTDQALVRMDYASGLSLSVNDTSVLALDKTTQIGTALAFGVVNVTVGYDLCNEQPSVVSHLALQVGTRSLVSLEVTGMDRWLALAGDPASCLLETANVLAPKVYLVYESGIRSEITTDEQLVAVNIGAPGIVSIARANSMYAVRPLRLAPAW